MSFDYIATPLVAALGAEMVLKNQSANQGHGAPMPVNPAWQPLAAGDTVALIAPSYATQQEHYGALADTMREWGLNVIQPADLVAPGGYYTWPNTPERRADHIIEALRNPDIKAIFALEGGEGAAEVVEILKKRQDELDALPRRAIPLIGYSDVTHLHTFLGQKGLVSPVQGPSTEFLTERDGMDDAQRAVISENQKALQSFLMASQQKQPDIRMIPVNKAAQETTHVRGMLIGGGDIPIALADQSSHRLSTDAYGGQILFLEGRNSNALRLTLSKLQNRQQLGSIDAIVLGRYYDNQQYTGDVAQAYTTEVKQVLEELGITKPVYFGVPAGHPNHALHTAPIVPLPMHAQAEINATPESATLSVGRFRDMGECDYRRSLQPPPQAPAAPPCNESPAVVTVAVPMNGLRLPDTGEVMGKNINGKHVVLQFGEHATIPLMHMALTELAAAGKLSGVQSLLIASTRPVPPEAQSWLEEFRQRHAPDVPMRAAEMTDMKMISMLSRSVEQALGKTGIIPGQS